MRLVSVTTMIPSRSGFAWWLCEIDLPDDLPEEAVMDWCAAKLVKDGLLRVTKLDVEYGPNKTRIVKDRRPAILGLGMVGTIMPTTIETVEN